MFARVVKVVGMVVAAAVLAAGCKDEGAPADRDALAAEVARCATALEQSLTTEPADRLRLLASGCRAACPGVERYGEGGSAEDLLAGCELFCSEETAQAWRAAEERTRFATLAAQCGPAHFGLDEHSAALLSETWLVLEAIQRWLEPARKKTVSRTELQAQLERATLRAHMSLALPAQVADLYRLPASTRGVPVDATYYAILSPFQLRVGTIPVARLRGELERRPVPGGPFPGQPVEPEQIDERFAEFDRLLDGLHPQGPTVRAADRAPLLLADADLPADRLFELATAMGAPALQLAVAGSSAGAHPVRLRRLTGSSAAPLIALEADGYRIHGGGEDIRIPAGEGAAARFASDLRHLASTHAPLYNVEVSVHQGATVADLVALLDAAAEARITGALFRPRAKSHIETSEPAEIKGS